MELHENSLQTTFFHLIYALCMSFVFQAASQVHGGQFAAGFIDGSVRLYDVRTPEM